MSNKKRLLWLDDNRNPEQHCRVDRNEFEVFWVKGFWEFKQWLNDHGLPDRVSFDYILGDMDFNGLDCFHSMLSYCMHEDKEFPEYSIHSTYSEIYKFREGIENGLNAYGYEVVEVDREDTMEQIAMYHTYLMKKNGGKVMRPDGGVIVYDDFEDVRLKVTPVKSLKIGRNEVCYCGSGKKYKKCCMGVKK